MKKNFFDKILFLLPKIYKKSILYLIFLLLIGVFLEMLGLGFLIPAMKVIMSENIIIEYPFLKPFITFLGNPSRNFLIYISLSLLVLIYILKSFFLYFLSWQQAKINSGISSYLSKKLFIGYIRLPYFFHVERNSTKLLSNIQTEIGSFYNAGQAIITITIELTLLISILLLMILVEPIGTIILITFFTTSAIFFQKLTNRHLIKWGEIRVKNLSEMNKHLLESFGGIKEIILLGIDTFFIDKIKKNLTNTTEVTVKQVTLQQIPRFYLELISIIGLSSLISIMVFQGKSFNQIIPTLGIFFAGTFRLIPSLNRIMSSFQSIQFLKPSIDVIYNEFIYLDNFPENIKPDKQINFNKNIILNDVSFKYNGTSKIILNSINLEILKGQTIGLIGPSGSGKSTLIDIILGLFKPSNGKIIIDNNDLENYNIKNWQKHIGYVPQLIFLTDDTIKNNIAFGIAEEDIDINRLKQSIEAAQLNDFINNSPDGIFTQIGERGVKLSGGQRQRIGIARALYNNPQILILDEATSALDSKTENEFMKAIDIMRGTRTIIIIAHRLTTLKNCDKIYSLNKGILKEENKSIIN